MCTVFPTNKTTHAQSTQTPSTVPRAICPDETVGADIYAQLSQAKCVGAAPACPPERPRSGVSIPKNTRIVYGELNDGCALVGRHGRAHRHRPYQTPSYFCMQSAQRKPTVHVNPSLPISTKPRGVPIPRRGYTFDSAGLASATLPTLGNDVSEEATPLGVVLFPITT